MFFLGRISSASATIILSFVLAIAAIVSMAIWWPAGLNQVQNLAQGLENWLTNSNLPVEYNVWLNFLIDDQSLTFMMFTIIARILVAIFLTLVGGLLGNEREPAL